MQDSDDENMMQEISSTVSPHKYRCQASYLT